MVEAKTTELDNFYQQIGRRGHLLTGELARRWTRAVLQTLGFHLDRRTKRKLAKALPPELGEAVADIFWLLHFRNPQLTAWEFQKEVAKRSGHTDAQFARFPILAVFRGLKEMIDEELSRQIARSLAPEVRQLWEEA